MLAVTRRLYPPQSGQPDILLETGDRLEPYGLPVRVVHTPGSCCLVLDDGRAFAGDLAALIDAQVPQDLTPSDLI